jgi:hypothetical protein
MYKKILIIFIAFVCAFGISEILIGNIFGFPKYGVKYKLNGIRSPLGHQNIYMPYAKYWGAKEEFGIYSRNNLGLTGIDVDTGSNSKYIFVLGSSFIECDYLKPEVISTSVLQVLLKGIDKNYSVLNLGHNGVDPYESYRLSYYYEENYKPELVILVINNYNSSSYKFVENPFELNRNLFYRDNSLRNWVNLFLKNNSSVARLILTLFSGLTFEQVVKPIEEPNSSSVDLKDLEICLMEFNKKYKDSFVCVSIMNNDTINSRIDKFCSLNKIGFEYSRIMIKENQISGDWHLNDKGNYDLGNFMFEVFRKHYIQKK